MIKEDPTINRWQSHACSYIYMFTHTQTSIYPHTSEHIYHTHIQAGNVILMVIEQSKEEGTEQLIKINHNPQGLKR